MTVRQILAEERDAARRVQTIAFLGASDPDESPPDPDASASQCWASFTDSGVMAACFDVIPYTMMFDGHPVKMGGIGSVSTLPEHRHAGHVRAIFAQALAAMRDEGVLFSYLYPFSHEFYRKFGYELCSIHDVATFQTEYVNTLAPSGRLEHYQKDDDVEPFLEIHRAFSGLFNLAVVQDEQAMRRMLNDSSDNARRYVYLWRDSTGRAKSYLAFTTEGQESPCVMVIRRFEWLDDEGFQGMLSQLRKFSNPYETFRWHVPPSVDYAALAHDPWKITCTRECSGMNRVVDVRAALALLKPPEGDGSCTIAVTDHFLDWNNSCHTVEWSGGQIGVSQAKGRADATVPVTTLVQLMCGFTTPAAAQLTGAITIDQNEAALERLFPLKPVYITERF